MSSDLDTQFRPPAKYRPEIKRISKRLAKTLTPLAHEMGYALMTHGSLERDLDLLAVPWIEEAVDPRELVKALAKAAGGYWSTEPAKKPHGREAYTIILRRAVETPAGCFPFIDLSVIAKSPTSTSVAKQEHTREHEITSRNRALVSRAVGLPSVETVTGGLTITSWSMLDDIIEAARAQERAITIERCAAAAEAQDRAGYEWLRESVWAAILKRAGQNVRALAHRLPLPSDSR